MYRLQIDRFYNMTTENAKQIRRIHILAWEFGPSSWPNCFNGPHHDVYRMINMDWTYSKKILWEFLVIIYMVVFWEISISERLTFCYFGIRVWIFQKRNVWNRANPYWSLCMLQSQCQWKKIVWGIARPKGHQKIITIVHDENLVYGHLEMGPRFFKSRFRH